MIRYVIAASVVLGLSFVLLTRLPAQNANPAAPANGVVRWQHLAFTTNPEGGISNPEISRQINKLGNEGWELVDVETFQQAGTTQKTVYFFKRPQ